jgi:hypothetical protein
METVKERILGRIQIEHHSGCWLWTGAMSPNGYGMVRVKKDGVRRTIGAHRALYIAVRGEPPAGMDLDHLCRVRHCVNPDHLEPVTRRVNTIRGIGPRLLSARRRAQTHFVCGHEMNEANTGYRRGKGERRFRYCLPCSREVALRRYYERKARHAA